MTRSLKNRHHTKRVMKTKWIRPVAVCVAMLGLSACGKDRSASNMNQIYVETPFSIAKAGNRATLYFEAMTEQATPGKHYMVSLTFDRIKGTDPIDAVSSRPPRTLLPFKVKLVRLAEDGAEYPVALDGGAYYLGEIDPARYPDYAPEDPAKDFYYAFNYAIGYSPTKVLQGYLRIASFVLKQPGHYRAEVETVQDRPIFADVSSVLIVQKHFNLGE